VELVLDKEVNQLSEWFYDTYGTKQYKLDILYNYNFSKLREELLIQISSTDRKKLFVIANFITDVMKLNEKYIYKTKKEFLPNITKAISKAIAESTFHA